MCSWYRHGACPPWCQASVPRPWLWLLTESTWLVLCPCQLSAMAAVPGAIWKSLRGHLGLYDSSMFYGKMFMAPDHGAGLSGMCSHSPLPPASVREIIVSLPRGAGLQMPNPSGLGSHALQPPPLSRVQFPWPRAQPGCCSLQVPLLRPGSVSPGDVGFPPKKP